MAPLTRMRAANPAHAPTELHVQYYAQRAAAGLIIGECTEISLNAYGWADTPGLWSAKQIRGWRVVTDAVHEKGGLMYAQLWHLGAMSHPDFYGGSLPISASNVNPEQESVTPSGRKPTVAPRPMTKEEIRQTVYDYGIAAKNALEAGFDGVQIQANYLYLIAQFLNSSTNLRKDEYGGSTTNRARFLFEIIESVLELVEPGRVGVKIGPMHIPSLTPGYKLRRDAASVKMTGPFTANADTLPDMEHVIKRLNDYNLAHLLMMGATADFTGTPLEKLAGDGMFQHFRALFHGHLIANVEMTQERGNRLIREGLADSIAFARPYIANPDLTERFLVGAPLNEIHWPTVYASGPKGYIDYPTLNPTSSSKSQIPHQEINASQRR